MKTLGLLWMASEDQFTYHSVPIDAHFQYPKWNSLKKRSSLFDSLGFLEPWVTRNPNLLMQDVCVSGKDLDKELNKECKNTAVK